MASCSREDLSRERDRDREWERFWGERESERSLRGGERSLCLDLWREDLSLSRLGVRDRDLERLRLRRPRERLLLRLLYLPLLRGGGPASPTALASAFTMTKQCCLAAGAAECSTQQQTWNKELVPHLLNHL